MQLDFSCSILTSPNLLQIYLSGHLKKKNPEKNRLNIDTTSYKLTIHWCLVFYDNQLLVKGLPCNVSTQTIELPYLL